MTDPTQVKARFSGVFSRAAETYSRAGADFFEPAGRRLVEIAKIGAGEQVLDVGAGAGACTFPAAEAVGPAGTVLAIDLAEGMVARLRRTVAGLGLAQVEVHVGDAEDPPVDASSLDAVLAGFLLFFLPDLAGSLGRYLAALRPGGRLAASWFGADDSRWDAVYRSIGAHIPAEKRPGGRRVPAQFDNTRSFEAALTAAGFTDVRTVEEPFVLTFPHPEAWHEWSWSHGLRAIWELVPADRLAAARLDALAAVRALGGDGGRPDIRHELRYTVAWRRPVAGG